MDDTRLRSDRRWSRHTRALTVLWLTSAMAAVGCRTWPAPTVDVHRFAARARPPMRVVFFPPVCRESDGGCERIDAGGVAGRIQSELELAGYTIVDGGTLVAEARQRASAGAEVRVLGERLASAGGVAQQGALFDDLPPDVRRRVLEQARADGILRVQILLSPREPGSLYDWRSLEVQARLGVGPDETPAWAVRCGPIWVASVQSVGGPGHSYADGAETGARCVAREAARPSP